MSERFKIYKKDESLVHNYRRWGNWLTNGMLGLGSILTAIPPTAPLGGAILAGSIVDKSSDISIGKTVEQKYDQMTGRKQTTSKDSGRVFNFGESQKKGTTKIAA